MRRLILLSAAALILVAQGGAGPADSAPWTVSQIAKSDSHRHAKLETGDTPGPLKYLHLELKFDPRTVDHKLHTFRVVDSKGKQVGESFGQDPKKSVLIFEKDTPWSSLDGLYLDGLGQRVPLFQTRPPATQVVQPTPAPNVVDRPQTVIVPPRTDNVVRVPATPTYVPHTESVIVEDPADRVLVHPNPEVVMHDEPDVIVHDGDTTRHVVHHHAGGGGGGAGHGHGGGGGTGVGGGGGGCPYGPSCPICGDNAEESLESLDPWAFDEMGRGRYDDLLARIENSGAALNFGSAGSKSGSGTGAGSGAARGSGGSGVGGIGGIGPATAAGLGAAPGAGDGLGIGQGGGPLPGMAARGSGPGRGPGTGSGAGAGSGAGSGSLPGMGPGPGQGSGSGPGSGSGTAQGAGQGSGEGAGSGVGPGPGDGRGPGPEDGNEPGPEEKFGTAGQGGPGQGPGQGPGMGPGPGELAGPVESAPNEMMPTEPIPGENYPMNMNNPMMPNAPGNGAGGGTPSMGPNVIGPRAVNLAPQPRFRVHNIGPDIDLPERYGPVIDIWRRNQYYYDPRWRFDPRMGQMGYGNGYGGGGGEGYGGGGRYDGLAAVGGLDLPELPEVLPETVLYISAGNDGEQGGKIYQVNDVGRVLGIVHLPYQATGLALHRDSGLIAVTPRDRGKIYRIDDTGELSVVMEGNSKLPHPVDVGVAGDSDTILVADSVADVLAATSIAGTEPIIYQRFEASRYEDQRMSVAVTRDKHVMFGTDSQRGIYRFGGDEYSASRGPMLPGSGGVATDPKSLKWAATQSPNLIHLFEGEMPITTYKLAPGNSIYGQGLLSFAPAGAVVVATRPSDEVDKGIWLTAYFDPEEEGKQGRIQNLFMWERERMLDFVVGPRMLWERHSPSTYESKY